MRLVLPPTRARATKSSTRVARADDDAASENLAVIPRRRGRPPPPPQLPPSRMTARLVGGRFRDREKRSPKSLADVALSIHFAGHQAPGRKRPGLERALELCR